MGYTDDLHSLSHTKWNCKYHVVFAPKYQRKVFFGEKRYEIGQILRALCRWRGVNLLEAEACLDHIHMFGGNSPEDKCIKFYGIPEGKK